MASKGSSPRIDSPADARTLLGIGPKTHGYGGGLLKARLVSDPTEPSVVADFAATLVLSDDGRRLEPRRPLHPSEVCNAYWIVYGSIVEAADKSLAIERMTVTPAIVPHDSAEDAFAGVTGSLLRLISPTQLLAEAVERLRRAPVGRYPHAVSEVQKRQEGRIKGGRVTGSRVVPDEQIESIARHYVYLYRRGMRRGLLAKIAADYGLTVEQARDRIHRARNLEFLLPSKQGRISAEPGPRLPESTLWQFPTKEGDNDGKAS